MRARMRINDAHCHFFSVRFFDALFEAVLRQPAPGPESPRERVRALAIELPSDSPALADRWMAELDANGVSRAVLIASTTGDEQSVADAVARHPDRFVGFFMFDPTKNDAAQQLSAAIQPARRLQGVCLFPAMHRYPLYDDRVATVFETAAAHPGTVVFVHCGALSVGIRRKLGLVSHFDVRFGNPLDLHHLATRFANVPIVIPHLGAGLFRETLMLADLCPNVYLDTSSSNGWIKYCPGLTLRAAFEQALALLGARRLLFGTDSSFFPRGWQRDIYETQRRIWEELGVSDAERALIMGGNFDRLFPAP